ncbi:hypothetical protein [Xylanibacter brevis]|uniref:hypothetical protein n=1 Tax=Xylanibacter brevis TaxID=83231 RepID=UPI0012DE2791|nr:hypothetical protein [Xylanibacter brevis]
MEGQMKLNVLWVDDMPTNEFMDEAYEYGLSITSATSVNKGLSLLKDKSIAWDAIILDANCKLTDDEQEQPSLKTLKEAIGQLIHMRTEIPWFVYTGGDYEGVEHLEFMIKERAYDDRLYYEKPKQRYDLYNNIKKAVESSEAYIVRQKHASVCNFYTDYDLVELLINSNKDSFVTDTTVPGTVRKIIERIFKHLDTIGLLPVEFKRTNLAECSKSLEDIPQIVPIHVIRSMHFCVDVCNPGAHATTVHQDIVSNVVPYLNKSILLNLLNILHWCPTIKERDKEEMKAIVAYCQNCTMKEKENRRKKNNLAFAGNLHREA